MLSGRVMVGLGLSSPTKHGQRRPPLSEWGAAVEHEWKCACRFSAESLHARTLARTAFVRSALRIGPQDGPCGGTAAGPKSHRARPSLSEDARTEDLRQGREPRHDCPHGVRVLFHADAWLSRVHRLRVAQSTIQRISRALRLPPVRPGRKCRPKQLRSST